MRALALLVLLALPAAAQDRAQTLADIRAELSALSTEIAALRSEMVTTGSLTAFGGVSALDRMDAIEAALTSLNARTEALQLRLDRIVADATNRLADLEFRIVELEGGDVAALATPAPLGETATGGAAPVAPPPPRAGSEAEIDRAREVLGQGDFRAALAILEAVAPTDPLIGTAAFLRGRALDGLGETADAARAYLDSFTAAPDGAEAPEALYRLGLGLGTLGQVPEACVTLGEVEERFPGSAAAVDASAAATALGCR
jgi:TolA-binding protein